MRGSSNVQNAKTCSKLRQAFALLLQAFHYANDTDSDSWEFAVGIRSLQQFGLSDIDFRWLTRKGYVEHAREITMPGDDNREFQPTGKASFSKRTCFVLTKEGAAIARSVTTHPLSDHGQAALIEGNGEALRRSVPHWDDEIHELRIDGRIVKRYKWPAVNQQIVLNAFQEEGWPVHIDDPLPPRPQQDSKRRLSDTIKCLNRKQTNRLIHFRGDGTGEGVIWERVPKHGSTATDGLGAPTAPGMRN